MRQLAVSSPEGIISRKVFPSWSVEIPASFDDTFVHDGAGYWHAWDEHRSVSMTSYRIDDKDGPVSARRIARRLPELEGTPVDGSPPGVTGRAVTAEVPQPARATQALTGTLAADGAALVVTITSDDLDWARRVWLSIRHCSLALPSRRERRARRRPRRR